MNQKHEKRRVRSLDHVSDSHDGHYVKPTLPGNQEDDEAVREAIMKSKRKLSRIKG
jgi:hypothetical protein